MNPLQQNLRPETVDLVLGVFLEFVHARYRVPYSFRLYPEMCGNFNKRSNQSQRELSLDESLTLILVTQLLKWIRHTLLLKHFFMVCDDPHTRNS